MTTLIRIFFFSIFLSYFPNWLSAASCASGNLTISSVMATSGNGSYSNPALGSVKYEFCFRVTEYFESSTNWVHGVFVVLKIFQQVLLLSLVLLDSKVPKLVIATGYFLTVLKLIILDFPAQVIMSMMAMVIQRIIMVIMVLALL